MKKAGLKLKSPQSARVHVVQFAHFDGMVISFNYVF